MNLYQINIRTHGSFYSLRKGDMLSCGSFYSLLKGDMLFGMFCRVLADSMGKEHLEQCLSGYTQNNPFIIFSDAFPCGYVPKPTLPFKYYKISEQPVKERKEAKRKKWLPIEKIGLPTNEMVNFFEEVSYVSNKLKTSVHLDPETHHTTGGEYSAYTTEQLTYLSDLSIYVLIDEEKISLQETQDLLKKIGQIGYGKKASSGNGKFELLGEPKRLDFSDVKSQTYLTLAPCVPQQNTFDGQNSFYHIFVRFGKHGGEDAHSSTPFKKPVMTADSGAVFTFNDNFISKTEFIGTGITDISLADSKTVFQGYAPVIALNLKEATNEK